MCQTMFLPKACWRLHWLLALASYLNNIHSVINILGKEMSKYISQIVELLLKPHQQCFSGSTVCGAPSCPSRRTGLSGLHKVRNTRVHWNKKHTQTGTEECDGCVGDRKLSPLTGPPHCSPITLQLFQDVVCVYVCECLFFYQPMPDLFLYI